MGCGWVIVLIDVVGIVVVWVFEKVLYVVFGVGGVGGVGIDGC